MIDFYEELNLDENDELDDIQNELERLEVIWKRRRTSNMDLAQKKLGVIDQAQKAFESESSKEEYDKALYDFKHPKKVDSYAKRKEQFLKYKAMAENFYNRKEYDLAKEAIVKADNFADDNIADIDFYKIASDIYVKNDDTKEAINYINKAIMLDSTNYKPYYYKAVIYMNENEYEKCAQLLKTSAEFAENENQTELLDKVYDSLADIYFYILGNKSEGYLYAEKALKYNRNSKESIKILEEVETIYNEAKKNLELFNPRKITTANKRTIEDAKELFESIKYYKDAKEKIVKCDNLYTSFISKYNKKSGKNDNYGDSIILGLIICTVVSLVIYFVCFLLNIYCYNKIGTIALLVGAVVSFAYSLYCGVFVGFNFTDVPFLIISLPAIIINWFISYKFNQAFKYDVYTIYTFLKGFPVLSTVTIINAVFICIGIIWGFIKYMKYSKGM